MLFVIDLYSFYVFVSIIFGGIELKIIEIENCYIFQWLILGCFCLIRVKKLVDFSVSFFSL